MKLKLKDIVFEIQGITSLSTIESKRLLDTLPALVKTGLEEDEANKIKASLEALGAEVKTTFFLSSIAIIKKILYYK